MQSTMQVDRLMYAFAIYLFSNYKIAHLEIPPGAPSFKDIQTKKAVI